MTDRPRGAAICRIVGSLHAVVTPQASNVLFLKDIGRFRNLAIDLLILGLVEDSARQRCGVRMLLRPATDGWTALLRVPAAPRSRSIHSQFIAGP